MGQKWQKIDEGIKQKMPPNGGIFALLKKLAGNRWFVIV
jgi:hypothetical protein